MEGQATVPVAATLNNNQQNTNINKSEKAPIMNKHFSEPKFKSYKQQILKIPKVKQILNKDKFVYSQDIEKRIQLIGTLKSDNYKQDQIEDLQQLRKKVQKKTKRHKTNFKIPLTRKNMQSLNNLLVKHINQNQIYKNEEIVFLKKYYQNAPYDLQHLKFMDKLDQVKTKFTQKYPDINQRVLSKNKLVLQNVILNRNIKRQIKLDHKKQQKIHSGNVFKSIQNDAKVKSKN